MNQDKYPGIYAAMGDMEMRRHERLPMGEMGMRGHERPIGEIDMRTPERMPGQTDTWYRENMPTDCIDHETELRDVELAHAYVPFQKFCPTFTPLTALRKGTAFPGLVGVYGWQPKQEIGRELV
jgi:Spore coat associated protein JA (CotJA)